MRSHNDSSERSHLVRPPRRRRAALLVAAFFLLISGTAMAAFVGLPTDGSQVNDDPANGIDPARDAGASDVTGGSLAGGTRVPWATFEQQTPGEQNIFVRAFKGGQWVTQGNPASLNIDPAQEAEAPTIDFAGANRTVPWVTWYEPNNATGEPTQIFGSRFDATAGKWVPEGQDRVPGSRVPSLNINLDRTAENPAVVGGATVAGNAPVPWVAWEENDGAATDTASHRQIFVSKGIKQPAPGQACTGDKPSANASVSAFCWQQVGLDRLGRLTGASDAAGDPTLNVDPTRNGVEPDFAFTGPGDVVPWVVWYEKDASGLGLADNEQVFAAKAVADPTADGGFHWVAVGAGTAGQTNVLDRTGAHGFGACAESTTAEAACTLNAAAGHDAEDPRVAAGTLVAGKPTVPWVAWSEDTGSGTHGIFVSRLVGDHFELVNGGKPISTPGNDASVPDITFSHNTPYVSWQEDVGGVLKGFYGHFEGADTFVDDIPGGEVRLPEGRVADLRAPISSSCASDPFSADGATCPAAAVGTPFFTFTEGPSGGQKLFAEAYQPGTPATGPVIAANAAGVTVRAKVQQGGAPLVARFEFGPTKAYGAISDPVLLQPASGRTTFTGTLTRNPPSRTIHYRAVVQTDFGALVGKDRRFRSGRYGVGVKIRSTSARRVRRSRRLAVDGWANHPGRIAITARIGGVRIGSVSHAIGKPGKGAQVPAHRLAIHVSGAAAEVLRAHPHRTITATAVTRDRQGRTAHITSRGRLGT
jgi:hypothetical protein